MIALVRAAKLIPEELVEPETSWFFNELGIESSYFLTTNPKKLAEHVLAIFGAKGKTERNAVSGVMLFFSFNESTQRKASEFGVQKRGGKFCVIFSHEQQGAEGVCSGNRAGRHVFGQQNRFVDARELSVSRRGVDRFSRQASVLLFAEGYCRKRPALFEPKVEGRAQANDGRDAGSWFSRFCACSLPFV